MLAQQHKSIARQRSVQKVWVVEGSTVARAAIVGNKSV
jgi:hypothetical protein